MKFLYDTTLRTFEMYQILVTAIVLSVFLQLSCRAVGFCQWNERMAASVLTKYAEESLYNAGKEGRWHVFMRYI